MRLLSLWPKDRFDRVRGARHVGTNGRCTLEAAGGLMRLRTAGEGRPETLVIRLSAAISDAPSAYACFTFADGPGEVDVLAIYQIENGEIAKHGSKWAHRGSIGTLISKRSVRTGRAARSRPCQMAYDARAFSGRETAASTRRICKSRRSVARVEQAVPIQLSPDHSRNGFFLR
jgi:hypothetical protein